MAVSAGAGFFRKKVKKTVCLLGCLCATALVAYRPPVRPAAVTGNLVSPEQTPKQKGRPNILWITTEGVPLKVLSCYGSKLIQTPNIDRIAREGMLFRNSFCTNALCAPSRATFLTGKYVHLNGMLTNPGNANPEQAGSVFDPSQETFAKLLKQDGYKTGMVGKWHLENNHGVPTNPASLGFDYFVFKNGAGGPYYDSTGYLQNAAVGSSEIVKKQYPGYITHNETDLAIRGMEQMKNGPFLMAIQFFSAHRPFDPPHKYEHLYDSVRIPEPATFWDDYQSRSAAAREARMRIEDMMDFDPPADLTPRQRRQWNYQQLMRRFLATLKAQDDNIGRLLDYLDKSGLAKNTIVVLTGDHGFFLGEHGWFDKRFMYEEALRVPWLVRYPGLVKPGSTSDAFVANIDNAPTILDMAGIKVPADMQGRSLMPLLRGKQPADWRTSLYYHYYEFGPPHWAMPCYGIRTDRYKLICYYSINEWGLFDLEKDPDEMENLIRKEGMEVDPAYTKVLQDLLDQLTALRKEYKDETGGPVKFWPIESYN